MLWLVRRVGAAGRPQSEELLEVVLLSLLDDEFDDEPDDEPESDELDDDEDEADVLSALGDDDESEDDELLELPERLSVL